MRLRQPRLYGNGSIGCGNLLLRPHTVRGVALHRESLRRKELRKRFLGVARPGLPKCLQRIAGMVLLQLHQSAAEADKARLGRVRSPSQNLKPRSRSCTTGCIVCRARNVELRRVRLCGQAPIPGLRCQLHTIRTCWKAPQTEGNSPYSWDRGNSSPEELHCLGNVILRF